MALERLNAGLARMKEQLQREGTSPLAQSAGWSVYSTHLADYAAGALRKALYVLFGVVALVLLIAAANVAGLFLARASARSKEFAIRMALGASAARMVRQSLVEALLLAGTASAVGLAAGPLLGRLLLQMVPGNLGEGFDVKMQPAVMAFTVAVGLLASIIAGVGPAIKTLRQRGRLQLHESGRSNTASAEKQRLRSGFVIAEVALAFVLLTGTGLFLTSLRQLQQVNPGFNAHGVVAGELFFSGEAYKNNPTRQAAFVDSVLENLAGQPGVKAVAAIDPLPFTGRNGSSSFEIEGRPAAKNDPGPHSQISSGTENLLRVMQIPLLAGRWFSNGDRANAQPVVVVDARLAHRYWPNENPVGKHLRMSDKDAWSTVVGVVGNIRTTSLETDTSDGMRYYPWAQSGGREADFLVQASGGAERFTAAMRNAIASADATQTLSDVIRMDTLVSNSLAGRQLILLHGGGVRRARPATGGYRHLWVDQLRHRPADRRSGCSDGVGRASQRRHRDGVEERFGLGTDWVRHRHSAINGDNDPTGALLRGLRRRRGPFARPGDDCVTRVRRYCRIRSRISCSVDKSDSGAAERIGVREICRVRARASLINWNLPWQSVKSCWKFSFVPSARPNSF